jgi:hypothetical protein
MTLEFQKASEFRSLVDSNRIELLRDLIEHHDGVHGRYSGGARRGRRSRCVNEKRNAEKP